jgi:hypothetical protein
VLSLPVTSLLAFLRSATSSAKVSSSVLSVFVLIKVLGSPELPAFSADRLWVL